MGISKWNLALGPLNGILFAEHIPGPAKLSKAMVKQASLNFPKDVQAKFKQSLNSSKKFKFNLMVLNRIVAQYLFLLLSAPPPLEKSFSSAHDFDILECISNF